MSNEKLINLTIKWKINIFIEKHIRKETINDKLEFSTDKEQFFNMQRAPTNK